MVILLAFASKSCSNHYCQLLNMVNCISYGLFNFSGTCSEVDCWAIVVEALGVVGMIQLFFFTRRGGHSLKCLHWACLSFWLELHFLLKCKIFFPVYFFFNFTIRSQLLENLSRTCFGKVTFFFFKLAEQDTRKISICDEPKCEISYSDYLLSCTVVFTCHPWKLGFGA